MKSRLLVLFVGFLLGVASAATVSVGAEPQSDTTKKAVYGGAKPIGPYTPGIQVGNLVFLAGQIGLDPTTGKLIEGGIEAQVKQAMENLGRVLEEAGLGYQNVVKTTIYLTDIDDYAAVNKVYASFFPEGSPPPARSTIQVAAIPAGASVEIDFIATR